MTVKVNDISELAEWMYWESTDVILRLLIPAEIMRMHGAFAYRAGVHPFIEALKAGPEVLRDYYAAHRPQTIAEAHWVSEPAPGVPPIDLPWIGKSAADAYSGEKGLGPEHGISMYGPCSARKTELEYDRLRSVARSISKRGYSPDKFGDVRGNFLRRGSDFRFFVIGGKHRAAALAYLGAEFIPVTFASEWPRVVEGRDSACWPLVADGQISASVAQGIFDSYFDMDGSQQYKILGLS